MLTRLLETQQSLQSTTSRLDEIKRSKGLRIKVIRFRDGMSYMQLAKSSPLGKYAVDKLRLLNGDYPDKDPVIGELIKIVE